MMRDSEIRASENEDTKMIACLIGAVYGFIGLVVLALWLTSGDLPQWR